MPFQLSPGVLVVEKDFTNIVPAVATTPGAYVGVFEWGPADEVRLLDSEDILAQTFGRPNDDTFVDWWTSANFLSYGNNLQVIRVVGATAMNATADGTGVLIKNENEYLDNYSSGEGSVGSWAAKYPGIKGNSLKVCVIDSMGSTGAYDAAEYDDEGNLYSDIFVRPGTSRWVADRTGITDADDEMHILVIDTQGEWSGVKGTILERFGFVSKAVDAKKPDGTSNYYKNVMNAESKYIWWMDDLTTSSGVASVTVTAGGTGYTGTPTIQFTGGGGTGAAGTVVITGDAITSVTITNPGSGYTSAPTVTFSGTGTGASGTAVLAHVQPANHTANLGDTTLSITSTNKFKHITPDSSTQGQEDELTGGVSDETGVDNGIRELGWDIFKNADTYDVSLVPTGGADSVLQGYIIDNLAETRKDLVVFVSPALADVKGNVGQEATDVVTARNALTSSSYAVMDSGWKYQYDKYNDVYRWIPLNGDLAGLCARTDLIADPWFSPGGYTRGRIKNVVKLAFSPNKSERDKLYINGVNPVVTFPGDGTILFGDKTMQAKPSAFDRINVRRLFIVLEKAISKAAKYQLFEFNDEFTRAMFRNMVEPFLRDVQGRRGITDFKVVCDETNNTGEVIDRNEFVADIYVKPTRSINFITLNFIATKSGVSFEEVGA